MQSTQSVQSWLAALAPAPGPGEAPAEAADHARPDQPRPDQPRPDQPRPDQPRPDHERDARHELTRLTHEIAQLVRSEGNAREVVDNALESVTRMQIAAANLDACRPPAAAFAGSALVALADAHLRGHSDAIERGMAYTADNQLRLLASDK